MTPDQLAKSKKATADMIAAFAHYVEVHNIPDLKGINDFSTLRSQLDSAITLLEQTSDLCSTQAPNSGPYSPHQNRLNPFQCRHCLQRGPTPPRIQHSPSCLITRINQFLSQIKGCPETPI